MGSSSVGGSKSGGRLLVGLTAVALAVLSVYFVVDTVGTVVSLRQEREGTVSVTGCEFVTFTRGGNAYSCSGIFTSLDAPLRLQPVTFDHAGDLDAGSQLAASVSGPGDDTATVGSTRSVALGVAIAVASLAGLIAILIRERRRTSAGRASAPERNDEAGTEVPADAPSLTAASIAWTHNDDGEFPYRAAVAGRELVIRVNDFPAEPLYTVIADGFEVAELEDWPSGWTKPARRVLGDDRRRTLSRGGGDPDGRVVEES